MTPLRARRTWTGHGCGKTCSLVVMVLALHQSPADFRKLHEIYVHAS